MNSEIHRGWCDDLSEGRHHIEGCYFHSCWPLPAHGLFHNADARGGYAPPPPTHTHLRVWKLRVVELSGKNTVALVEYSRLVVRFLILGQYLTQLWEVKGQIFAKPASFQHYIIPRRGGLPRRTCRGGGGGQLTAPLSNSASRARSEKHKNAIESSSKIITKVFQSIFRWGQYWDHQRSSKVKWHKWVFANNFWTKKANEIFRTPSCSSRRDA